jgi:hypothetical protein
MCVTPLLSTTGTAAGRSCRDGVTHSAGALGTSIGGWALSTTLVVLYLQAQQRRAEEDIRRILTGAQVTLVRIPF